MENQEYKKMVLFMSTGYAGMDAVEFWKIPVNLSENELNDLAWKCACSHAESYDIYPESHRPDAWDDDEEEYDRYSDNIGGYFEDYSPKLHDGERIGGDESWQEY